MVDDTFRSDIRTCNNYLKVTTEDKDNPLLQHGIDDQNAERAQPKLPGYVAMVANTTTPSPSAIDKKPDTLAGNTDGTKTNENGKDNVKKNADGKPIVASRNGNPPLILTGVTRESNVTRGSTSHTSKQVGKTAAVKPAEPKK